MSAIGGMTSSAARKGSIENDPPAVVPAITVALREGYLRKQAQNFGRDWGRRYFLLTSTHLYYYHHQPVLSKFINHHL